MNRCENLGEVLGQAESIAVVRVLESNANKRLRESPDNLGLLVHMPPEGYSVYVVETLDGFLNEHCMAEITFGDIDRSTLTPEQVKEFGRLADDSTTTSVLHIAFLKRHMTPEGQAQEKVRQGMALYCEHGTIPLHPETDLTLANHGTRRERILALVTESCRRYSGTVGEAGAQRALDWCLKQ